MCCDRQKRLCRKHQEDSASLAENKTSVRVKRLHPYRFPLTHVTDEAAADQFIAAANAFRMQKMGKRKMAPE